MFSLTVRDVGAAPGRQKENCDTKVKMAMLGG